MEKRVLGMLVGGGRWVVGRGRWVVGGRTPEVGVGGRRTGIGNEMPDGPMRRRWIRRTTEMGLEIGVTVHGDTSTTYRLRRTWVSAWVSKHTPTVASAVRIAFDSVTLRPACTSSQLKSTGLREGWCRGRGPAGIISSKLLKEVVNVC